MLNLNSVMIGTQQPQELAAVYEQVIGKPADMVDGEQGFHGWQVGSAFLGILRHSEMGGAAKDPGRIMLNFETARSTRNSSESRRSARWSSRNRMPLPKAGSRPWPTQTVTTFN